jgi:uncharacterized membrane protein
VAGTLTGPYNVRGRSCTVPQEIQPPARARIESVDWVRGMVMILMLLDHARDFIHRSGFESNPLDAATTTVPLYLTRWVTHLCAPTFVFLAGMSARLQLQRGIAPRALARFLWTRGLFLVGVELFVLRPMIFFDVEPGELIAFLQVIWALGWSMVALAALVFAPIWFIAAFGASQVLLHNLFDAVRCEEPARTLPAALWSILHQDNAILLSENGPVAIAKYPLIPWVGVMALGFVAGAAFALEHGRRKRLFGWIAALSIAGFFLLRWSNLYGDPQRWGPVRGADGAPLDAWRTVLSFFDVEKYPPSLLFLAITLGIAIGALALLDGRRFGAWSQPVITFGRVPLFFYLLQWPLLALLGTAMRAVDGQNREGSTGFGLPGVYLGWALGLAILYPACRWFAGYKRRSRAPWLGYL